MKTKKVCSAVLSAVCAAVSVGGTLPDSLQSVSAASFSYPVQEFRFGIYDTDRNLNVSGTESGSYVTSATLNGTDAEKWYLNYISAGVYEIVNVQTGYVLTNDGGLAVIKPDSDAANQRWNITAVEQDFDGFDLYYKVTSNADSSVALTFQQSSNSVSAAAYSGDDFQKFRLDLDGLEGFGAASLVNGKMKAGTIGGLLGETVFVNTLADLISALDSTDPKTVVITANIDMVNQDKTKQRIRDDKTIVGAYSGVTVYDSQLRNDDFYGADSRPSQNIVIRNVNWCARTLNSDGCGVILLYFYGVRNLWVDHNSFSATFSQNRDSEVGKFMWINTPPTNWSDGVYNAYNPDYITISYNYLLNRYWTFAFGSQNTDTSRLHTTVMFNKWEQCSRRCPQYSNGYDHNYNNYHTVTNGSNANKSSQVIGGEGSRVVNENCRFEGYSGNELDPDRNSCLSFVESGSYTASSPTGSVSAISFTNLNASSAWTPSACYGYALVSGYNTSGTDIKDFCNNYSGAMKADSALKYITDSDMSKYVSKSYACPFRSITVGNDPVGSYKTATALSTQNTYTIRNLGSGLYLGTADGAAANDADVQQGSAEFTWTLEDAGDGYYKIYAQGSKTYLLDLDNGKTDNGTNIQLYTDTAADAQLFKFVLNEDGTYLITTKATKDSSCLGVAAGSTESGATVIQWECDGTPSQSWIVAAEGDLFRDLTVTDYDHIGGWYIEGNAAAGSLVFGDRTVTYTVLPEVLTGAEYLVTACDAKYASGSLAQFVAGADLTVYVAMDQRVTAENAWLSDWTKSDLTCQSSNDVTFVLWTKDFSAGETVTLGENGQSSSCVGYTVFAVKQTESVSASLRGDVDCNGKVELADAIRFARAIGGSAELSAQGAANAELDGVAGLGSGDLSVLLDALLGKVNL